jgi:hypothetical protein
MKSLNKELHVWVLDQLINKGFEVQKLKVKFGLLQPVAVRGQGFKNSDFWTGLYHLIAHEKSVYLYIYNQETNDGELLKSDFFYADIDINAFNNVKLEIKEDNSTALDKAKEFLNQKNKQKDNEKAISAEAEITGTETKVAEADNKKANEFKAQKIKNIKDLYNSLKPINIQELENDRILLGLTEKDLESVKLINSDIILKGLKNEIQAKCGDLIVRYSDHLLNSDLYVIKSLNDNIYSEKYVDLTGGLNFKFLGGEINSSDSWVFISEDLLSAVSIYRSTETKTIVVPSLSKIDIYDLLKEIKSENEKIKIAIFRNEDIREIGNKKDLIFNDKKHNIFHVYLDFNANTWAECSDIYYKNHLEESDFYLKELIKMGLKYSMSK